MKIALPSRQNQIDEHFGHCEYFTVFTVDDTGTITSREIITPPAGCGCKSNIAVVLKEMGVRLMIAGNMGQGAVNVLNNSGIDVIRGISGDVQSAAQAWLAGELKDSGIACGLHEHGCQE